MRARRTTRAGFILLVLVCGLTRAIAAGTASRAGETDAFEAAARVFEARCSTCHGGARPKMGLRLEREAIYRATVNVPSRASKRQRLVVPGDPLSSALYLRLLPPSQGAYRGPRMPLKGDIDEAEIAAIRAWIESFPKETWSPTPPSGAVAAPLFHDRFLADLPSPDTLGARVLEFRFSHRFRAGASDAGADNLWGLDGGAWISLGLGYGLTDRIDVGLRRTNQLQNYEGFLKAAFLQQTSPGPPLSLALFGSVIRLDGSALENRNRWSVQIIAARRLAEWLSVELVPTYVSPTNFLDGSDTRGTVALGAAAEIRMNSFIALTAECVGQLDGVKAPYQAATIGLSVRTANHAFHLLFTNARNTHTDLYAPGGDLDWSDGDFRLGFNISRTFEPMASH